MKISSPPPPTTHPYYPCNVVPLFELPAEKKHHTLNWGEGGGVLLVLFSEVTLFVSTILLLIVTFRCKHQQSLKDF